MLQSRMRNSRPMLEFSSLGLFRVIDWLHNCTGQVLYVPKAKFDEKWYCQSEKKKKALSAEVLNHSLEQRQLLSMYLLSKMKMRKKKVLKLGNMLSSMQQAFKYKNKIEGTSKRTIENWKDEQFWSVYTIWLYTDNLLQRERGFFKKQFI